MRVFSVIAEFNPFHNGHKYLIDQARKLGGDCVAVIMSGNFVQRGGCAIAGKYARARSAVLNGADIVFELPAVYSVAAAEYFALGGVMTINACGCVNDIVFGSECGDINTLYAASDNIHKNENNISAAIKTQLQSGVSYPRAVSAAANEIDSDASKVLSDPNDTLAIEYLNALKQLNCSISPHCVKRIGVSHNASVTAGDYASASQIRAMILNGDDSFHRYMPESAAEIIDSEISAQACPVSLDNNNRGVLTVLRQISPEQLRKIPEVSEGLENRIIEAARKSTDIKELIMRIKCKRYTYARIHRIITNAYIGAGKYNTYGDVGYIRVLAFNSQGREMLRIMKKTAHVPVIINARDFEKLSGDAARMFKQDLQASDMYSLCLPKTAACGIDYYTGAVYVKNNMTNL